MAYAPSDGEWVQELLADLGPLTIKRMFGAAGVYHDGLMFAVIDDGVLWLKADEENVGALEAAGSRQFEFQSKDGEIMRLGYWTMPDVAVDEPDEACRWARASIEAARRKAAAKKKPKKKTPKA